MVSLGQFYICYRESVIYTLHIELYIYCYIYFVIQSKFWGLELSSLPGSLLAMYHVRVHCSPSESKLPRMDLGMYVLTSSPCSFNNSYACWPWSTGPCATAPRYRWTVRKYSWKCTCSYQFVLWRIRRDFWLYWEVQKGAVSPLVSDRQ